ncbi:ead/Ea22-like family protein [Salmonella enterica]|nr:ead/Ea22-like family protein [Salmonella enterica]EFP4636042.1 ead/Ea22-like family protein [Salmonella enterica]EFS0364502.1 ead/Ea22-like family protein [Salmonella enterica]EGK1506812.1 ead/Ea22-like family protein [Salmonella enterica]
MSNIDKQALREVAEKATPGNWRRTSSLFNGITVTPFSLCGEEVTLAHTVEKRDAEFIAAANPAIMLALLDELEAAKQDSARWFKAFEKAVSIGARYEERIEQLEKGHQEAAKQINSWRRLAKQNIAERGKDISELEAARQRIAELESKLSKPVLLPKTNGYWTEQEKAYEEAITLAKRQVRLAGFSVEEM